MEPWGTPFIVWLKMLTFWLQSSCHSATAQWLTMDRLFKRFKVLIIDLCVRVLGMCRTCMQISTEARGSGSPCAEVTGGCKLPRVGTRNQSWVWQEHYILLTTERSLQPLNRFLLALFLFICLFIKDKECFSCLDIWILAICVWATFNVLFENWNRIVPPLYKLPNNNLKARIKPSTIVHFIPLTKITNRPGLETAVSSVF